MAKTDIWMPIYIGDYLGDTQHLSAEKHGIYLLLMMHYWIHGPLENDLEEISFVARSTEEKVKKILEKFFKLESGHWKHGRIEKEKAKASTRSESARSNAKKRWDNQKTCDGISDGNATEDAKSMLNGCSSSSPSSLSLPTTSKPPTPTDLMRVVWEHWNKKDNLPNDPYMPTSMRDPRRLLDVIQGHGVEKVKECIDKLDRIYPSLDKKPSTPGSLLSNNSITHWLNVEEEKTITESEKAENDRIAMEVFG